MPSKIIILLNTLNHSQIKKPKKERGNALKLAQFSRMQNLPLRSEEQKWDTGIQCLAILPPLFKHGKTQSLSRQKSNC